MRIEYPTPPWNQYPCDRCEREAVSLHTESGQYELQCYVHAEWPEFLERYPNRAAAIAQLRAEGRSEAYITQFALRHIKLDSYVERRR